MNSVTNILLALLALVVLAMLFNNFMPKGYEQFHVPPLKSNCGYICDTNSQAKQYCQKDYLDSHPTNIACQCGWSNQQNKCVNM